MEIRTFALGPLETNCHVLVNDGCAVAVDPGGDPAEVLAWLDEKGARLEAILNTHLHFDHVYGNAALSDATGATIFASEGDRMILESELGRGGLMGLPEVTPYDFSDIKPGRTEFCGLECDVLPTPGHSPGSMSFHFPLLKVCFVGDLIFYRSVGRTDFPGGDLDVLKRSVDTHVFVLPDTTVLYAGHGPTTTVGDEKNHNPFVGQMLG